MVDTTKLMQNVLNISNNSGCVETLKYSNIQIKLNQIPKIEFVKATELKFDESASIKLKCNVFNSQNRLNTPKTPESILPSKCYNSNVSNNNQASNDVCSNKSGQTAVKPVKSVEKVKLVKPLIKDGTPVPKLYLYPPEKIELGWKTPSKPGSGLYNTGVTCFLNSGLQCLTYTPPLANYLLKYHKKQCNVQPGRFCMLCVMLKHISTAKANSGGAFKPISVINSVKIIAKHLKVYQQEDSHEFIKHCVMAMQKACLAGVAKDLDFHTKSTTVIDQIFGFYLRSRIKCLTCQITSDTFDLSHDLQLDIIKNMENTSVNDSIKRFVKQELLKNDNAYKCSHCKKKVTASKKFSIFNAPNIITLQLKRFVGLFGNKCSRYVSYPEKLNLRPHMSDFAGEPVWYKLYAVLVHSGFSSKSGHYYAFAKAANNNWYCFNDSNVYQVGLQKVLRQEAYCLFYEKVKRSSKLPTYKSPPHNNGRKVDYKSPPHSNGKKVDFNGIKRKLPVQNEFDSSSKIQKLLSTKKNFSSFSFHKKNSITVVMPKDGMPGEIMNKSPTKSLLSSSSESTNSDMNKVSKTSNINSNMSTEQSKQNKENKNIQSIECNSTSSTTNYNRIKSPQNENLKRKFDNISNGDPKDTNLKQASQDANIKNKQDETNNHKPVCSLTSIKNNYSSSDSDGSPPVKKINSFAAFNKKDKPKTPEKSVSQKLIEQSQMHSFGVKNLGTWDGTSSSNSNKKKVFVRDEWDREYDKGKKKKNKKKNKNKFSSMNNNANIFQKFQVYSCKK